TLKALNVVQNSRRQKRAALSASEETTPAGQDPMPATEPGLAQDGNSGATNLIQWTGENIFEAVSEPASGLSGLESDPELAVVFTAGEEPAPAAQEPMPATEPGVAQDGNPAANLPKLPAQDIHSAASRLASGESGPDLAIVLLDHAGKMLDAHPSCVTTLEWRRDELVGRDLEALL